LRITGIDSSIVVGVQGEQNKTVNTAQARDAAGIGLGYPVENCRLIGLHRFAAKCTAITIGIEEDPVKVTAVTVQDSRRREISRRVVEFDIGYKVRFLEVIQSPGDGVARRYEQGEDRNTQ